ncbi:MAG: hypothetical protein MJ211_15175 [Bacteroidales bacterium]|nr:hypothetical protein [Bacteroidales bacterium]
MKIKNLSLRILSVLCCCILATNVCWAGLPGGGTKDDPYLISSYNDLILMASWSNRGDSESGIKYNEAYYKLENDIVFFEGESLTINEKINSNVSSLIQSHNCIGTSQYPFNGTFDGNGKKLKKVYYEYDKSNSVPYVGLFGVIGKNAVIQNVKIEDSYFYGNAIVGGICGYNNGGKIIGCSFSGVVNNDCKGFSSVIALGGICGYNCGTIEKCINSGYVNPSKNEVEC